MLHRTALICVAALVALGSCSGEPVQPDATGAGTPFEFEVLQWRCRHSNAVTATKVVSADLGEFCFIALDVVNTGEEAATLDPECQYLLDRQGGRHMPDPEVMALDDVAVAGFGTEIGPGEVVENSALYYDVRKGTDPRALELHGECKDDGVTIPLSEANGSESSSDSAGLTAVLAAP
jgi:hypothetical protein